MLNQPNLIPMPFANDGDANTIPTTNTSPTAASAASWTSGFPVINSTPLAAGGIPPARGDFNGIYKALSEHIVWQQAGNLYEWSNTLDYVKNAHVRGSDGYEYAAVQPSGPNVTAGAVNPTTDNGAYWVKAILSAAAIYVDGTNGSDSNDGMTIATAVATITKALEIAQYVNCPNQTNAKQIIVSAGTYNESIEITQRINLSLFGNVTITGSITSVVGSYFAIYGDYALTINGFIKINANAIFLLLCSTCNTNGYIIVDGGYLYSLSNLTITSNSSEYALLVNMNGTAVFESGGTLDVVSTSNQNAIRVSGASFLCNAPLHISVNNTDVAFNIRFGGSRAWLNNTVLIDGASCTFGFYIEDEAEFISYNNIVIGDIVSTSGMVVYSKSTVQLYSGTIIIRGGANGHALEISDSTVTVTMADVSVIGKYADAPILVTMGGLLYINYSAYLSIDNTIATANALYVFRGTAYLNGNISISGSYTTVFRSILGAAIYVHPSATLLGTPTGLRYVVNTNSTISVDGAGANRIPGSSAGYADAASFGYYG